MIIAEEKAYAKFSPMARVTKDLRIGSVVVNEIKIAPGRMLPPDEATIKRLMASIQKIGLLCPIIVWRPTSRTQPKLIAGLNRFEACKRLGYATIDARVIIGDTPEIRQWCKLVQIETNLREP